MSGDSITRLVPEPGYASAHVASCVGGIEVLHTMLLDLTRELTPAQLAWQSAPGRNTVGMLLAHVAVAEVHLGQVGLVGERDGHVHDVLEITMDDDGLPLPAHGAPPAALAGRPHAFFAEQFRRALAHTRAVAMPLADDQLDADIVRPPRPDGTRRIFNRRWVLFHMIEHAASHLGQLQVLVREAKRVAT